MFTLAPNVPHFVELEVRRPFPLAVLQEAFGRMGLGHSLLDTDRSFETAQPDRPGVVRFLTGTLHALQLRDVGACRWLRAWRVEAPLFNGIDVANLTVSLWPVERGTTYDVRFFVKAKNYPTRDAVIQAMTRSGFDAPLALCLMDDKHTRLPDHAATLHQWYARARWGQGDSVLTVRDKILVDEMKAVFRDAEPSEPTKTDETSVADENSVDSPG